MCMHAERAAVSLQAPGGQSDILQLLVSPCLRYNLNVGIWRPLLWLNAPYPTWLRLLTTRSEC